MFCFLLRNPYCVSELDRALDLLLFTWTIYRPVGASLPSTDPERRLVALLLGFDPAVVCLPKDESSQA